MGLGQTKSGERGGRGLALAGVIIGLFLVVLCIGIWIFVITSTTCVRNGSTWDCTKK